MEGIMKTKMSVKDLALSGVLIALVFVATYFIQFQLPFSATGGLVHMGNVALFTIAMVFGSKKGAISGAFGMALFDIFSGWFVWAPGTFIVRGIMGLIIGLVYEKRAKNQANLVLVTGVAIVLSSLWMMGGYYIVEGLLYGNWIAPMGSIPGNITQISIGWIIALPLSAVLKNVKGIKGALVNE
jgi:uncharacterized membrane protein